ncbi:glycosyltransferase family 4 protein [Mixta calida]|uniref:glycosyltransferase family 4 protein n=1 Tax=Mixta calida TaxID=665913 RepID=UPI00289C28AE|nr:glycosyltransferase family 4 protein [Mixta calida]MDU4289613.1 glycosyltransferase family 4 protein [Mixta calida]
MKIAHVQVIPKMSGVQQVSLDILNGINDENIQKYVICGTLCDDAFTQAFNEAGVHIIPLPSIKREIGMHDIVCLFELIRLFKKEKFDIIHTNSTKPGIIARIAAKLAGIKKIIHTVHGIAFHKHVSLFHRFFYYVLENFATLFGDVNVTVNRCYVSFYPFVKSKVIYNGVDFSKLNVTEFEPEKRRENQIHFAFLARLDEQKNPLEFVEAVNILLKNYTGKARLKFTLAGDGELSEECKVLIETYNLQDHIAMPGWIKDKDTFFNNVDVLCQPSKWEAFGLVFVEAAFYRIPAIARRVEGIPEVVLDGSTGILYSEGAHQLAEKMNNYIENPESITVMGHNARINALEKFSKERMLKEYNALYFG